MDCPLCGFSESETILAKPSITIFTNTSDEFGENFGKHNCILKQCKRCGHVFQPISKKLRNTLEGIYQSNQAQLTTSLGVGSWGKERAPYLFEKLKGIDNYKTKSVLEVGCGNGYILKILKEVGFQHLVGIEPSLEKTEEVDGILFLKEFASNKINLDTRFDFIFTSGVYEHIPDIDSITSFCNNHLDDNGVLFIYVPNCSRYLADGDPAVFAHEHIHYFVESSIKCHLSKYGYEVIDNQSDDHALAVYAKKNDVIRNENFVVEAYKKFQNKIDGKLEKVSKILSDNNSVIIHGACNGLNNILGWLGRDFDYTLVDNDNTKHGKTFFGKRVESFDTLNLVNYDTVLIIPAYFSEAIKAAYVERGFRGQFKMLT